MAAVWVLSAPSPFPSSFILSLSGVSSICTRTEPFTAWRQMAQVRRAGAHCQVGSREKKKLWGDGVKMLHVYIYIPSKPAHTKMYSQLHTHTHTHTLSLSLSLSRSQTERQCWWVKQILHDSAFPHMKTKEHHHHHPVWQRTAQWYRPKHCTS